MKLLLKSTKKRPRHSRSFCLYFFVLNFYLLTNALRITLTSAFVNIHNIKDKGELKEFETTVTGAALAKM